MVHKRLVLGWLLASVLVTAATATLKATVSMDATLDLPPDVRARLRALKGRPKFLPEEDGSYTGVQDPAARRAAEAAINGVIERVEALLPDRATKAAVLKEFSTGLDQLALTDTEDREQAAGYLEQIMDCLGMESSDGLLNKWMYGFDPT